MQKNVEKQGGLFLYNLLIVDDEIHAVEGIQTSVDWEKISIDDVFAAYNIQQAKDIIKKERIDVILCDIEMPQGNGLELLKWLRDIYPDITCIFLTCHAEFNYARKAIQLGSFDYLLKPASANEIEEAVNKAVAGIEKEKKIKEDSKQWLKYQSVFVERFWFDILTHKIPETMDSVVEAARVRNISIKDQNRYLPILVSVQRWHKELSLHDQKVMEFAIKRAAQEIISKERGSIVQIQNDKIVVILSSEDKADFDINQIRQDCESYIKLSKKYFSCGLLCYIGNGGSVNQLANILDSLIKFEFNNVTLDKKVFFLSDYKKTDISLEIPDLNLWTMMINQGLKDRFMVGVEDYLEELLKSKGLNVSILHQFQQYFVQMIYSILRQKGIHVHQIFDDELTISLYEKANKSIEDMLNWIEHDVSLLIDYIKKTDKESPVEKSKRYIENNLEKRITRDDIAEYVGYNVDYLNRIFKEETGYSLAEYLLNERIAMAKELLTKTNMQISTIAAHVGYTNFSHFSKMFKRYTDQSPSEYRDMNG